MKAIPEINEPELYKEIELSHSRFVKLADCDDFEIKMQYPLMKLKNSVEECFVRAELYDKLLLARSFLPDGIKFRIFDAWRPLSLQIELYDLYREKIIAEFGLINETEEKKNAFVSKYVSYPSDNIYTPPVHTTGGAVDLTLVDITGNELRMGTEFDSFSEMTQTDYFEKNALDSEIRNNRRMLYNAMIKAGFTNLPSEWWHYDFGDRFWAYYNKKPAIYEGVFTLGGVICD